LDADTTAFFREIRPWAFILFREACVSRAQVRALTDALREAAGHDAIIWIDQEGGRVARLKAPEWPVFPAPRRYGGLYQLDASLGNEACYLGHRLIAHELRAIGVDGDYAPVLDRPVEGAHDVIGDRAYSDDGKVIAALGASALAGLHAGGVVGCIKHMPGHGRAEADTHFHLPRVKTPRAELALDMAPFITLNHAPSAMTAHIVYEALDPDRPATCSPKVIGDVIRGEIGFQGLLMTDDMDMKALASAVEGGLGARAAAAHGAGCDVVLQCNGVLADMIETARGSVALEGKALERARVVEAIAKRTPNDFEPIAAWMRFNEILATPGS
jgi:beta-N-acetylhexosaminidase